MGRLIVAVLVVALGWMGWWAFGSSALERSLAVWIDQRRAEGWAADVAEIKVAGFPNRFDTTMRDVTFADPETGVAWSAPFLQLLSLAYRPYQVIAVLPNQHRLSTPLQTLTFSHDRARGSIFLQPKPSLPLDRLTVVIDDLQIRSTLGWRVSMDQGRIASEPVPTRVNAHRVGAEILDLALSEGLRGTLDPGAILPREVSRLHLDADVTFDRPWDRSAIEVARPQITGISLTDLSAVWGDVTFRAAGDLSVDTGGIPSGEITVRAVEWRRLLDMAVASGLVPQGSRRSLERGLGLLASLSGNPDTLDAPLTFKDGLIRLGPVSIGVAPRIIIR